ncbi:hypothetical protein HN51_069750 [Arachis hypogaea]
MLCQRRLSALHRRRTEAPSHSFPDLLPVLLASLLSNPNLSSPSRSLRSFSSSAAASAAIVKEVRNLYIHEMELLQIEKELKDEACRESLRVANEERKKLKAEAAQIRAPERKIAQQ